MAFKRKSGTGLVYVGIRGMVVAMRKDNGEIAWSVDLRRGSSFVPLIVEDDHVFAVSGGEVTCLDGATGALIWHNPLKGYGMGYALIGGSSNQGAASAVAATEAAAASTASTSAASH